jgi:hypothetical protein
MTGFGEKQIPCGNNKQEKQRQRQEQMQFLRFAQKDDNLVWVA